MATDPLRDTVVSELRLNCFDIISLYREFSYHIPLNIDQHVTAIIAPNGSGKTICLRLVDALFNDNWPLFESTEFSKCIFSFTDGSIISITRQIQDDRLFDEDKDTILVVDFKQPNRKSITWKPSNLQLTLSNIERFMPFVSRVSANIWIDERSNKKYTSNDVMRLYREYLPAKLPKNMRRTSNPDIQRFLSNIKCKLIETQRLFIFNETDEDIFGATHNRRRPLIYAISQKAETLRKIISDHINKYAILSQSLDRSFPRRVIRPQENNEADEIRDVERELSALDARRQELTEVGILDVETDAGMGVPQGQVQGAIAQVLRVYIKDNREKLATLDEIYNKIRLFKSLLASRFGKKHVEISKTKGLNVLFGDRDVPIEALSSGEQHQLVLFFELLFQTPRNSLILIDEPEISLHIAWQKNSFLTL